MHFLLCFSLLIATVYFSSKGNSTLGESTSLLPKLVVSGNQIVTERGDIIRLRGVNFMDPFVLDVDDLDGDGVSDRHFDKIEPVFCTFNTFPFIKTYMLNF